MMIALGCNSSISRLVCQVRDGDTTARDQLVAHVFERMQGLVRAKLRQFPGVQRWERESDVFQNVMLALCQKLAKIKFNDTRHFFAVTGMIVRRELIDLHRHHYGPLGAARHHATKGAARGGSKSSARAATTAFDAVAAKEPADPFAALEAIEVHQHIGRLPKELREVVGLLYYHGLTSAEAAEVLNISERTVNRKWDQARARLGREIRGQASR